MAKKEAAPPAEEGEVESFDESEELDDEIVTITDEEGNDVDCMVLAVMDVEGRDYAMLAPVEQLDSDEGDEVELFIFTYDEDEAEGVEHFGYVDDDAMYEKVRQAFAELMEQVGEEDEE
jgi:uncharacterized protein YrzB (UPF0473 family)